MLISARFLPSRACVAMRPMVEQDRADDANGPRVPYDSAIATNRDIAVYRISGAFFFGAAASVATALDLVLVADVTGHAEALAADCLCGRLGARAVDIHRHHQGAFLAQALRHGAAYSLRRTRYDGNATFKPAHASPPA